MHAVKRVLVAGMLAGSLALSACGSGSDTASSGSDGNSGEPVALRMTVWTSNEGHLEVLNGIAEEYVTNNPDKVTEVKIETLSDGYSRALSTQIAGGEAPDLAWLADGLAPEFVTQGVFTNVSETLNNYEDYDYSDILPAAMNLWSDDAAVYAYPFTTARWASTQT